MPDPHAETTIGGLIDATLDLMFGPVRNAVSYVREQFSLQRDTTEPAADGGAPVEPGETTIPPDAEADEAASPAPTEEPTYTPTTDEEARSAPDENDESDETEGTSETDESSEVDDTSEETGSVEQEASADRETSADQEASTEQEVSADLEDVWGVGPSRRDELAEFGYTTVGELAEAEVERLTELSGVGEQTASRIVESAGELLG